MRLTQKQLRILIEMCIKYFCISVIILEIISIIQILDRYAYVTDFKYEPGVINAVNWEKISDIELHTIQHVNE